MKRKLFILFVLSLFLGLLVTGIAFSAESSSFINGFTHGTIYKANLQKVIDNFYATLKSNGYDINKLLRLARKIEKEYIEVIPEKVEWMHGVAKATGIPYEDILMLNCFDKLASPTDECTSFLAQGTATKDGVTIVAKNRDLGADSYNAVELVPHRYPKEKVYRAAYIEIPQVKETYKFIGVKSVGRWGFGQAYKI